MENLNLGAYNKNARSSLEENRDFVFSLFPRLKEPKGQICSTLSGGASRMVAMGRGLMSAASILLLDEPSIGLSPIFLGALICIIILFFLGGLMQLVDWLDHKIVEFRNRRNSVLPVEYRNPQLSLSFRFNDP